MNRSLAEMNDFCYRISKKRGHKAANSKMVRFQVKIVLPYLKPPIFHILWYNTLISQRERKLIFCDSVGSTIKNQEDTVSGSFKRIRFQVKLR